MRVEDIQSYEDLQKYIRLQLSIQTVTRKTMELTFNDEWFFKFAKLIQFSLKHDSKEVWSRVELDGECRKYVLKVNKIFTIVKRK